MQRSDVIILGGGLVGLALAAALDSSGLSCTVVDPADPEARKDAAFDGRTSALSSSSKRMFDTIGISEYFPVPGCPIRRIEVADGLDPGGLVFDPGDDDEPLGWMNENRHLHAALLARAAAGKNITLRWKSRPIAIDRAEHGVHVRLDGGDEIGAPLLVAAEGRNSPMREAAGIRVARWKYDHNAIVSTLRHERPHENVAYEIFYPAGPFALLPMTDDEGGHRSAIVWSVKADAAPGFLSLSAADFAARRSEKDDPERPGGNRDRNHLPGTRFPHPVVNNRNNPRGSAYSAFRSLVVSCTAVRHCSKQALHFLR